MKKLMFALTVGGVLGLAQAAEMRWNNASGGNLDDGANWDDRSTSPYTQRLPASGDTVYFTMSEIPDCTLSADYVFPTTLNIGSDYSGFYDRIVSFALGEHALTADISLYNGAQLTVKSGVLKKVPKIEGISGKIGTLILDGGTCLSPDNLTITETRPNFEIKNGGLLTCESGHYIYTKTSAHKIVVGPGGKMCSATNQALYLDGTVEALGGTIECNAYMQVGYREPDARLVVSNGFVNAVKLKVSETASNRPDATGATLEVLGKDSRVRSSNYINLYATATLEIDLDGCPEESLVHAPQYTFAEGCKIKIKSSNKMRRVPAFEKAILTSDHTPAWANVTIEVEQDCGLELVSASGHELVVRHKLKGMVVILK